MTINNMKFLLFYSNLLEKKTKGRVGRGRGRGRGKGKGKGEGEGGGWGGKKRVVVQAHG